MRATTTRARLDTTLEAPIRTMMTEYDQSRSDRYQFGVDIRLMKRTTISFDQFFEHDKVDPNFGDNNLSFTDSVTGAPVDIGIPFPPSGCTIVPGVTFPGNNVLVTSAKCNIGLFSFSRSGRGSHWHSDLAVVVAVQLLPEAGHDRLRYL